MSSVIAHTAIAVGLSRRPALRWWMVAAVVFFSWLPDIDYGLRMVVDMPNDLRWSHSFVFVTGVWSIFALIAIVVKKMAAPTIRIRPLLTLTLVAGMSHLFMDWIIGSSWGDPLLWPFDITKYSSPFGVLPSSPKFSMSNGHMYKNLLIETGIIAPVAFGLYTKGRAPLWAYGIAIIVFVPFAIWGISLPR